MSADVYCQNQNDFFDCTSTIYSRTERRGNRLVARETERECVCATELCRKKYLASVEKWPLAKGLTLLT